METKLTTRVFGTTVRVTLAPMGTGMKVTVSECSKTRKPRTLFTAKGTAQDTLTGLKMVAGQVEEMTFALREGPRTGIHADLALAASALSAVRRTEARKVRKS